MTMLTLSDYIEAIAPIMNADLWGDIMERFEAVQEYNNLSHSASIGALCLMVYPYLDDDAHDIIVATLELIDPSCQTIDDIAENHETL